MALSDLLGEASPPIPCWDGTDPGVNPTSGNNSGGQAAMVIVGCYDITSSLSGLAAPFAVKAIGPTPTGSLSAPTYHIGSGGNPSGPQSFAVDTSGNDVEVYFPTENLYNGLFFVFYDIGANFGASPHELAFNGNGNNVQVPASLGTYGATTNYQVSGGTICYFWDAAGAHWKILYKL